MTRPEFDAIIADLERHLEGEGYWIDIRTHSGARYKGGWASLGQTDVIVLSKDEAPPVYLPINSIEVLQLSD